MIRISEKLTLLRDTDRMRITIESDFVLLTIVIFRLLDTGGGYGILIKQCSFTSLLLGFVY